MRGMNNLSLLSQVNLSIQGMVTTVVYLLILGAITWLLLWLVAYVNPPEPINKVARVIIVVFAVLCVIGVLLSLVGHPMVQFH